jgi:ABC-2 type transport system ATP-binding protein
MNATFQSQTSPSQDAFPLQARELSKTYEARTVLNRITLVVPQGAVLGLIGRNGAGKSTLLRCLLGLIEPGGGEAFVFGERALAMTDRSKQRLSYVPQQPDTMAWLEVGEMLGFVSRFYPRWDKAYVEKTLQRWGLPDDRALKTLSPVTLRER